MAVVRGGTRSACPHASAAALRPAIRPGRRRLDVAFHAGNLPGEEQARIRARLPRLVQHGRPVDVRVPVDHAEAHELRLLEPGNHAQHSRLLAPFHLRLKPDEAVMIAGKVVLSQLNGRVRLPAGPRIGQADRLHRPEPQRVLAAMRHHLDRQAPFEELLLVEVVNGRGLRRRRAPRRNARTRLGVSGQFK